MITDLLSRIPEGFLRKSGSVFYSGREAFQTIGDLYILGINPGGCPVTQGDETLESHCRKVLDSPRNWSAYRDESWRGATPGQSGMQPRVLHMLKEVGRDPGKVPASNVVFLRSKRESDISRGFNVLADQCWLLHQEVLDRLAPRVIVCFGRTSGDYVRSQLSAKTQIDEFVERNNRRWTSRTYSGIYNSRAVKIVVLTHPSIADWTAPSSDPSILVKRALKS